MSTSTPSEHSTEAKNNGSANSAADQKVPPAPGKQPWWQVMVVYPTLAVTLVTAIPTYAEKFEAWRKGLERQELTAAKERNRLITKNMDCMLAPIDWVNTANKTRVDATICYNTGDILVRLNWGADQQFMDVVSNDRIRAAAESEKRASLFLSSAYAASGEQQGFPNAQEQVICQRWLSDGHLLQRIQTTHGCFDQVLNTYRGVIQSRQPAPCSPQC
ncbi:hypothetical protein [Rhizobacter fulvus]